MVCAHTGQGEQCMPLAENSLIGHTTRLSVEVELLLVAQRLAIAALPPPPPSARSGRLVVYNGGGLSGACLRLSRLRHLASSPAPSLWGGGAGGVLIHSTDMRRTCLGTASTPHPLPQPRCHRSSRQSPCLHRVRRGWRAPSNRRPPGSVAAGDDETALGTVDVSRLEGVGVQMKRVQPAADSTAAAHGRHSPLPLAVHAAHSHRPHHQSIDLPRKGQRK